MKILELYSGIGGMHFALKGSTIADQSEVILAIDLNPNCIEIYRHNFPGTNLLNKNIISLNAAEINILAPDIILMSPPCQPFTRLGKQKDVNDPRNNSFLHFMKLLPDLNSVNYILIENVRGFEKSETRQCLTSILKASNFTFEEFLLNPRQFGICNSRLRYYLLAKRTSKMAPDFVDEVIMIPPKDYEIITRNMPPVVLPKRVGEILEHQVSNFEWDKYSLSPEQLKKYLPIIDIVSQDSESSCCFTRGYSRCMERTGSVLSSTSEKIDVNKLDLNSIRLRFFTPREIARLMNFPDSFSFPECITLKQRYKTLGNSVNVFVISLLISYLMKDVSFYDSFQLLFFPSTH